MSGSYLTTFALRAFDLFHVLGKRKIEGPPIKQRSEFQAPLRHRMFSL